MRVNLELDEEQMRLAAEEEKKRRREYRTATQELDKLMLNLLQTMSWLTFIRLVLWHRRPLGSSSTPRARLSNLAHKKSCTVLALRPAMSLSKRCSSWSYCGLMTSQ